jgi:DNA-binding XRE family transcriptional regulator
MTREEIGRACLARRQQLGLLQQDVWQKAGLDWKSHRNIEKGQAGRLYSLLLVLQTLGMTMRVGGHRVATCEHFGRAITIRRKQLGLGKYEAANRAGLAAKIYWQFEAHGMVRVTTALAICDALGLTVEVCDG